MKETTEKLSNNDELEKQVKTRSKVIGSIIIDGLFLLFWLIITVLLSFLTDKVVIKFDLSDLDEKLFRIFQWLFTCSTFITVVSFLIEDIYNVIMKTKYKISQISKKNNF